MVSDQEILNYIKSQQEVSIPELQKKFSADYLSIVKLIRKLVVDGVLRFDSGVQYTVIKKSGEDDLTDNDQEDDDESDDDEDDMAQRRAYIEARRREILRRMQEDIVNTDEDDDCDDETEVESLDDFEDKKKGSDDETPLEVYAISQELDEGVFIIESVGEYYLIPKGLEICGTAIRFKILVRDDGVYLSDDELAVLSLDKRVSFDDKGVDEQIGFIVDRYDIGVVGDELRIKVESPENAITCMMKLFAAMERIMTIDGFVEKSPPPKNTAKDVGVSDEASGKLDECPPDPIYIKALAIVIQAGEASISLVQRKCCIGYNHAGKIIEWMESMGYISPFDRSKGRQILITKKQFVKKYGPLD